MSGGKRVEEKDYRAKNQRLEKFTRSIKSKKDSTSEEDL